MSIPVRNLTFGTGSPAGSGEFDDSDFDGIINVLEYAFGLNPFVFDPDLLPSVTVSGGDLAITYTKNSLLIDLSYEVQSSSDLVTWTPVSDSFVSNSNYLETREASVTMAPTTRLFLRLKVTH